MKTVDYHTLIRDLIDHIWNVKGSVGGGVLG